MIAAASLESVDRVMLGLGLGCAVSAAISVAQTFGINLGIPSNAQPSGLFGNWDFLAETAAPLFVWAIFAKRNVMAGAMLVPLVLCGSRVAILSSVVGVAVMSARLRNAALLAGAAMVGFATAAPSKMASLMQRIDIWRAALSDVTFAGRGLGWFAASHHAEYAHSDILQGQIELGFGMALIVFVVAFALCHGQDPAARAALAVIAAQMFVAFPLHLPTTLFVGGLLAGYLARRLPGHGGRGAHSRNSLGRTLWRPHAASPIVGRNQGVGHDLSV